MVFETLLARCVMELPAVFGAYSSALTLAGRKRVLLVIFNSITNVIPRHHFVLSRSFSKSEFRWKSARLRDSDDFTVSQVVYSGSLNSKRIARRKDPK